MIQQITGCIDCPFYRVSACGEHSYCAHSKGTTIQTKAYGVDNVTPAWCPIKQEPIIITY